MAIHLDAVTNEHVDSVRYDDLSFETEDGLVGLRLLMPSVRQITIRGEPEIVVPYSAGWGEGRGAVDVACHALVTAGNVMAAAIDYPRRRLRINEIVPFRTRILSQAITQLRENLPYEPLSIVVASYSRGTVPARHAVQEQREAVSGLSMVAPTWFEGRVQPGELARKGIAESARGIRREGWIDKMGLLAAGARLAQEMVQHPFALRDDVASIAQEGAADLEDLLDAGTRVGVVAGLQDELCTVAGIRTVLAGVSHAEPVDYCEVNSDHFGYFIRPAPLRAVVDQIAGLAKG